MDDFYKAALEIGQRKLFRDTVPGKLHSPRLGTGSGFIDIFLWDTAFTCFWTKYHVDIFPVANSLDNFYLSQDEDGFISRQIHSNGNSKWSKRHPISFAPPILSWIELELHNGNFIKNRLPKVYPHLKALHNFNKKWQRSDGLYFSDFWGCGMDDIPRCDSPEELKMPGGIDFLREDLLDSGKDADQRYLDMKQYTRMHFDWNRQLGWVDTTAQVAFDALNLAQIATILGATEEAAQFQAEHDSLADTINELCYDEKRGFYCDRLENHLLNHKHIGGFWTLLAKVATPERAQKLYDHLQNPSTFGLPYGVPGISKDDSAFGLEKEHYWTGPVWCPTMYMILRGLSANNENQLAKSLAKNFYHSTRRIWENTGTIWENYSPLQCETPSLAAGRDFCGWSGLAPVSIYREYLS